MCCDHDKLKTKTSSKYALQNCSKPSKLSLPIWRTWLARFGGQKPSASKSSDLMTSRNQSNAYPVVLSPPADMPCSCPTLTRNVPHPIYNEGHLPVALDMGRVR